MDPEILPLQSTIGKGPYAVDACRLIPQELLICKPTDPFSVADLEAQLKKWKRQARVLNLWQLAEGQADPSKSDQLNLQQIRLYIATTAPQNRCLCTRRPLTCLEDHWPECPSVVEERIKIFEERQKKCHEMKVRHITKNLCRLLKDEVMDFIPDEEVRKIHSLFENELRNRSL